MAQPYVLTPGRSKVRTCRLCGKTTTSNFFFFCGGQLCLNCIQSAANLYKRMTGKGKGVGKGKGIPIRGPHRGRKWDGRKRGNWRWKEFPVPKTRTNSNDLVCGWEFEHLPENVRELAQERMARNLERFRWRHHGATPTVKQRALLVANVVSNLYSGTLRSCYLKWCWHMQRKRRIQWRRYQKKRAAGRLGDWERAHGIETRTTVRARVLPLYL